MAFAQPKIIASTFVGEPKILSYKNFLAGGEHTIFLYTVPPLKKNYIYNIVVNSVFSSYIECLHNDNLINSGRTNAANSTAYLSFNPQYPINENETLKIKCFIRNGAPLSLVSAHIFLTEL
jgi:hypothetical protein